MLKFREKTRISAPILQLHMKTDLKAGKADLKTGKSGFNAGKSKSKCSILLNMSKKELANCLQTAGDSLGPFIKK